jgi:dethiobiotin synthase
MKPLYISATKQDTGKTTVTIGLVKALRELGHNVGYMKPVGQRYIEYEGLNIDEDAVLAHQAFGLTDPPGDMSPIAIARGFTEKYILHRDPRPLEDRILKAAARLTAVHDLLIVEGTGHAGVGSCFDLSNARVAQLLGAAVIIVADGGIGRAIDEVVLSLHLFRELGVPVLGVILNKVWPEKYKKIVEVVTQGLAHQGTDLLAALPYCPPLVHPRVEQIVTELDGRFISGRQWARNLIEDTVIAAMAPSHVPRYLHKNALVVTPGDRMDEALASAITGPLENAPSGRIAGVVLSGGFLPPAPILSTLEAASLPVVLCEPDTYTVVKQLQDLVFKIRPEDTDKIEAAEKLVQQYMDVEALVKAI